MRQDGHSSGITEFIPGKKRQGIDKIPGTKGFIAIDGEGITINGEHRYVLIGIGQDQLVNEEGLKWYEIFAFLYKHYKAGIAYVGFYLSYDFDRWLRTMPENKVARLITSEGRIARKSTSLNLHGRVLPVDLPKGWQVNMLGKKMLEFRKRSCHCAIHYCKCPGKGPWMRICDAGPFFQTSFLKAIDPNDWKEPIVTFEEYAEIKKGKENRAWATCVTPEMMYYNRLENEILERLCNVLNDGFKEMGIYLSPGQWFGPGQAAQKWMKKENVPSAELIQTIVPQWFLEAARMSYVAGWFEIMMHGLIPGESHEYDINSAYPYIIANLPCLLHGNYSYSKNNGKRWKANSLVLVYARLSSFSKGNAATIGTMLHRDKHGHIFRPTRTEGWFWWHEIQSARNAKLVRSCHIYEWVSYTPCKCKSPMTNVVGLYDLRTKVGKDTPLGKGCRLAYNSMYGKCAQSVGNPMFANSVYASLITAGCRIMIMDAIASHPEGKKAVAMVATDAVYFTTPHPTLNVSKKLGEWDYKVKRNLTLFKPGMYWDDEARKAIAEEKKPVFKARGINASDFGKSIAEIDAIFQSWNINPPELSTNSGEIPGWPTVEFTAGFAMVSCLQAIRRGKWELAGHVSQTRDLKQNANPYDKRIGAWPDQLPDGRIVFRSEPWTLPLDDCKSSPYLKRFGMDDPWSLEMQEYYGITPDGTIPDLVNEVMYE